MRREGGQAPVACGWSHAGGRQGREEAGLGPGGVFYGSPVWRH